jgi:hypothetical protein
VSAIRLLGLPRWRGYESIFRRRSSKLVSQQKLPIAEVDLIELPSSALLSGTECPLPTLMQHGAGILRENCHDQDNRQCPGKDTLTPDSVGSRRACGTIFSGVVARARYARFKPSPVGVGAANGVSKEAHQASVNW